MAIQLHIKIGEKGHPIQMPIKCVSLWRLEQIMALGKMLHAKVKTIVSLFANEGLSPDQSTHRQTSRMFHPMSIVNLGGILILQKMLAYTLIVRNRASLAHPSSYNWFHMKSYMILVILFQLQKGRYCGVPIRIELLMLRSQTALQWEDTLHQSTLQMNKLEWFFLWDSYLQLQVKTIQPVPPPVTLHQNGDKCVT